MGARANTLNVQRIRGRAFLIVLWSLWMFVASYSLWSAYRVTPLYAGIPLNGQVVDFSFGYLPFDRYAIRIVVQTAAEPKAQRLKQSSEMGAIYVALRLVDSGERELIDYRGSTQHWQTSFSENAVLFYSDLDFNAEPWKSYNLAVSTATESAKIRQSRAFVIVVGNRDDGYYPLANILYLGLLLVFLLLLTTAKGLMYIGR
jgi:hypothetical protein